MPSPRSRPCARPKTGTNTRPSIARGSRWGTPGRSALQSTLMTLRGLSRCSRTCDGLLSQACRPQPRRGTGRAGLAPLALGCRDLSFDGEDTSWQEITDDNGAVGVQRDYGPVHPRAAGGSVMARVVHGARSGAQRAAPCPEATRYAAWAWPEIRQRRDQATAASPARAATTFLFRRILNVAGMPAAPSLARAGSRWRPGSAALRTPQSQCRRRRR